MPGAHRPAEFSVPAPTDKKKKEVRPEASSNKGVEFVDLIKYHIDD